MRPLAALLLVLVAASAAAQVPPGGIPPGRIPPDRTPVDRPPGVARPGPASPEDDRGWFAFGLGPSTPYRLAIAATANVGRTRFVQVGFHVNDEVNLFGRSASINALHVGAGLSRVGTYHRTALAAGPAVVWGETDDEQRFTTVSSSAGRPLRRPSANSASASTRS